MLSLVKNEIANYFNTLLAPGKYLEGVKSIIKGPVIPANVPDAKFPFISIYIDSPSRFSTPFNDGPIDFIVPIVFEIYTLTFEDADTAENNCWDLFWSPNKKTGLLIALMKKRSFGPINDIYALMKEINSVEVTIGNDIDEYFTYGIKVLSIFISTVLPKIC